MRDVKKENFTMTEVKNGNDALIIDELSGIRKELKGIKRKSAKQIVSIIIAVIISLLIGCGAGVYCGIHKDDLMLKINPKDYANATVEVLEEKLEETAKLNTGLYIQKSHFDSGKNYKKLFGKEIKITGKQISFDYEGSVEAGIRDLSKAKVEVNAASGIVKVTLPAIEITNTNIDISSLGKIQETRNIFNQISVDDLQNAYDIMEEQLKQDALNSKIIDKAQKNAEKTLRILFGDLTDGYQLEFVWE